MKKILVTLLSLVLAVTCFASVAFAADVSVKLDGETLNFEQPPVIIEGRTLVPLRAIFEALGASVEWDGDTKTVTSAKDDVTVKLTIGSNILYKNDAGVELDVPAQIVGEGYTMVPARAIAEAYGVTVDWDDATKTVILTSPAPAEETPAVEGAIVNLLTADNYAPEDRFYTSGTSSKNLVVVDNPTQAGDKVFYLEANVADKPSWTYFWVDGTDYKPGQAYIVEFDALIGNDVNGNEIDKASFGINFKYGQIGDASKDHGSTSDSKPSSFVCDKGEWKHIIYINSLPEDLDTAADMRFGIFGSPVNNQTAFSYYIDNFSMLPYDGNMANGVIDEKAFTVSKELESFDVDAITDGLIFDFDADNQGLEVDKKYLPEVADGHYNMTVEEGDSTDIQLAYKEPDFTADDYNAIAFKVKGTTADISKSYICVYFATEDDPKLSQDKCITVYYGSTKLTDDGYYVGYLDMSSSKAWSGKITSLRIDPMQEVIGTISIDKIVVYKK